MSNFREKANKIKAAGEAQRGNFTPTGAPKRVYDYWLSSSRSDHAIKVQAGTKKENFCHFWRVVMIWAPLHKIQELFFKMSEFIIGLFVIAALVVGGFVIYSVFTEFALLEILGFIGGFALIGVTLFGIVWVSVWASEKWPKQSAALGKWSLINLPFFVVGFIAGAATESWTVAIAVPAVLAVIAATVYFNLDRIGTFLEGRREVYEEKQAEKRANAPEDAVVEYREPGKISKFFTAVGDFIIMFAQVVRVNKWKICPLVEIDSNQN